MLYRAGFRYISTDITQSFYLMQNNLWDGLTNGNVKECIDSLEGLNDTEAMVHTSWWKLWELRNSDLEADIIVANHCLCEMHQRSLAFYLEYIKHLTRNSEYKIILSQAPGWGKNKEPDYLGNSLSKHGYTGFAHGWYIVAFAPGQRNPQGVVDMFVNAFKESERVPKVPLKAIEDYFASIDPHTDSPDEEFAHYIGFEHL